MKETLIIVAIVSAMNILCFLIGGKVAQMIYKGKEIKVIPNPVKEIKEAIEEKEISKEEQRFNIIAENIDNYSGNSIGQKVIPK
ncbi:MAG: hypothetical protein II625_11175 [Bacilli bacterium]|nr:hypothetical protein [Bacilli bacterium]